VQLPLNSDLEFLFGLEILNEEENQWLRKAWLEATSAR